jgi:decaprenylphospho-beta-D-ribofuranose 2-oxidase
MGLTGIVLRATLDLLPITSAYVRVDTERAGDLDDCMRRMSERDDEYRYSVAWVDSLTRGASMGRSVLTRGDHASADELPARKLRKGPLHYVAEPKLAAPPWVPDGLLRPSTVRAFNEVWFRKAPKSHTGYESIPVFFHPLDGVLQWNRIYGRPGFIQYQFAVPLAAEETVRTALDRLSAAQCPSFLTVLKRFGPANDGPLSFPQPGWTLTVDIPASLDGLGPLLDGLDERVVEAGGRVYLSKDSRLRPDLLAAMYPRLAQWRAERNALDPGGVLSSDLSRRLGLT